MFVLGTVLVMTSMHMIVSRRKLTEPPWPLHSINRINSSVSNWMRLLESVIKSLKKTKFITTSQFAHIDMTFPSLVMDDTLVMSKCETGNSFLYIYKVY